MAQIENRPRFGKYQLSACAKARIIAEYDAKPLGGKAAFVAACGVNYTALQYWKNNSRGDYWQKGILYQNQPLRSFPTDAAETREKSLVKYREEPKVVISESIPTGDVEFPIEEYVPNTPRGERWPGVPMVSFPPPVDEAQSTARIWIYVLIGFNVVQFAAHLVHWVNR